MSREAFGAREAMLAWMQEVAPYGIFTTDRELRVQTWNHWLTARSGWSAESVIGRNLLEIFPDLETRRLHERYRRALAGEISVLSAALHGHLLPFAAQSPGGEVAHMLQTARIAPLPAGDLIVGTVTIIEDVTERECQALILQRQQERDQLLSTALAVLLQSEDPMRDVGALFPSLAPSLGVDVYLNHVFHREDLTLRLHGVAGLPPKQKESMASFALGEGPCGPAAATRTTAIRPHLQHDTDPRYETLRAAGLRSYCCFPLVIANQLLGTFAVGSYSRDVMNAEELKFLSMLAQYMAIAIDRTQREAQLREAQLRLQEYAGDLENKVLERTVRLHDTIAQLESFSYTVAHDLRAPIRALNGYAEILRTDHGETLAIEGRQIIDRLQRATNRLDALTRDLLRFSRVARAEVTLEPVDVAELIQDLLLITPNLEGAVVVEPPLSVVRAQRTLLQQCFSNLFDNAVKFARPGAAPRIVVRNERLAPAAPSAAHGPHHPAFNPSTVQPPGATGARETARGPRDPGAARIRIWVEDNGVGIPPDARHKIFGIFERVLGSEHIEGTGIGLAIVARAMQQMGGVCGVESELGAGSHFWLDLPEWQEPAPPAV